MKVRIKKAPQMMAYGGQKKHSLDIVRTNIDDYKPDYNDIETKYHRSADPRDESNVEVEGDEVIVEKGSGGETLTFKAVGPDHSTNPNKEGGVPMDLKEGAFVFSKRKLQGMGVKGSVLSQFGKSEKDKKTYSFAELANQYKTGPLYDILKSDKTDGLQKKTAAAMIQNYEDKLASLALLQESKKGFPQGIPELAQEKFQKMMMSMQQNQQQPQEIPQQQMPMARYGMSRNAFIPDYSSTMYHYQEGGSTGDSENSQIMKVISMYAQLSQTPREEIIQGLQALPEAQQQEALQQMYSAVQKALSQQQGSQQASPEQMEQEASGYYSAPGGEPQYQAEQPSEEEQVQEQMQKGGSYNGTYYQGTYFADGGFVPDYTGSAYNDQFGGEMIYDNNYGMLPRADGGLEVKPPRKVTSSEFENLTKNGGFVRIPGTNLAKKGNKIIQVAGTYKPGTKGSSSAGTKGSYKPGRNVSGGGKSEIKYTLEDLKRNPNLYKTFLEDEGWKNATPEEQQAALKRLVHGERSVYVPPTPGTTTAATDGMCVDENGKLDPTLRYNTETGNCERTKTEEEFITYEQGQEGPKPGEAKTAGSFGGGNYGMPYPSTLGVMAAAAYPPIYIGASYGEPEGVLPIPTFYDPERELASAQETARGLEQMGSMMNPQTAGSMASYIQANAAKSAADTMGRYQNLNVGVANQFSPLQAQIFNSLAAQKREARDKRYMGNAVAAQQYNNAMRAYVTNFAKTYGEGLEAGIKKGQLYDTNPYYTTDAFGRLRLKPGVNAADAIMYSSGTAGSSSLTSDGYLKEYNLLKSQGTDPAIIKSYLDLKYGKGSKSKTSNDDDVASNYGYGQSAYPFTV
jgi:hypothetical protein